jgi:hypothetical protein
MAISCDLIIGVSAAYYQKALVGESGIIRTQMGMHSRSEVDTGMHNRSEMVTVHGCLVRYHSITVTVVTIAFHESTGNQFS